MRAFDDLDAVGPDFDLPTDLEPAEDGTAGPGRQWSLSGLGATGEASEDADTERASTLPEGMTGLSYKDRPEPESAPEGVAPLSPFQFATGLNPVTAPKAFPFSAIAQLEIDFGGRVFIGTAFFVTPNMLLTAGHNTFVFDRDAGNAVGPVSGIRIAPGRNGSDGVFRDPPFRQATPERAVDYWLTAAGWAQRGDPAADFAALFLRRPVPQVGAFNPSPVGDPPGNPPAQPLVNVVGYPYDLGVPLGEVMWGAAGRAQVGRGFLRYGLPTRQGQSGSPVYVTVGPNVPPSVRAIHTHNDGSANVGVRITPQVHQTLRRWSDFWNRQV